jgi:heme-degrading monooxygenase HmoA
MILEVAILNIKKGFSDDFEINFKKAEKIISSMKGYISHNLKKCIEEENKYILLVNWQTIEDHEIGFRKSDEYKEWKELLHHFYEPFPIVEHYI